MSVQVDLQVEVDLQAQDTEAIEWMKRALNQAGQGLPDVQLSVFIVDNSTIQELNARYRNIDRPTDVLSFPLWEADEDWILEEGETAVALGDIVISLPKAKEQAKAYGHSLNRELAFLAVHGFLHLIGYDHQNPEQEMEMFEEQEKILQQVGLTR